MVTVSEQHDDECPCKGHEKAVKFLEAQRGREEKRTVAQGSRTDLTSLSDNEVTQGTGSAYLLRRLARLGDDWMDRYEAGEFSSVRQAAIAAGIVKVPSVLDQLRKLWAKASKSDRQAFQEEVADGR